MLAISIFSSPLPIDFPAPAAEVEDEEPFVNVVFDDCPKRFIAANAASRLAPKGRCVRELLLTPALAFDELAVDIARNADWVRSFQNHDLNLYVPPYGRIVHHARAMGIAMLLADRARSCADDPLAFNRQDLDCNCHQVERFVKKALEVAA